MNRLQYQMLFCEIIYKTVSQFCGILCPCVNSAFSPRFHDSVCDFHKTQSQLVKVCSAGLVWLTAMGVQHVLRRTSLELFDWWASSLWIFALFHFHMQAKCLCWECTIKAIHWNVSNKVPNACSGLHFVCSVLKLRGESFSSAKFLNVYFY